MAKKWFKTKISSASADYSAWFPFGGEEDGCWLSMHHEYSNANLSDFSTALLSLNTH